MRSRHGFVSGRHWKAALGPVALLGPAVALAAALALTAPYSGDEVYHVPLAHAFSRGFPLFGAAYTSAYPPLPYLLASAFVRILGNGLWVPRFVNILVGALGVLGMLQLSRALRLGSGLWAAVFLCFLPYYFRNWTVFYVGHYGLIAVIWALWARTARRPRAAAAFLGAAALCGQWALVVVAAALASLLLGTGRSDVEGSRSAVPLTDSASADADTWQGERTGRWRECARIVVFQLPIVAVFAGWGGLTHPAFAEHAPRFSPRHLSAALAVLGVAFSWRIVADLSARRLKRRHAGIAAAGFVFGTVFLPEVSVFQGPHRFTGITVQVLGKASSMAGMPSPWLIAAAAAAGAVVFATALARRHPETVVARLSLTLLLGSYAFSPILGETHTVMAVALTFVALYAGRRADGWLRLVVLQNSALGISYTLYHALIKFR